MKRIDYLSEVLQDNNIKPSIQRIEILDYILGCKTHPTVEQINKEKTKKRLSLSKATIYNTLTLFVQKGLVRVLHMDNNETRYDALTRNHGHFLCESCGDIMDFEIDIGDIRIEEIKNCKVNQKDVYYRGVCQRCLKEKKEKE